MEREQIVQLKKWKTDARRKPLLLMGARQVGKTFLLKAFGDQEYRQTVYLNFEDKPKLKSLFKDSLNPKEIIRNMEIEFEVSVSSEDTLIIFDEVQECPEALNSLKYFNETAKEYHVCAAGSLLGVKLMHTKGFPVGQVNFQHLYPLSFLEFLHALGELKLHEFLNSYSELTPLPASVHEKTLHFFKIYLYVGGMPEAVNAYLESKNILDVTAVLQAILQAYSLDFAKHAPKNQIMKINQVWESIPGQLAKENKKFIYSVIRKGARAKEFEEAIQWLAEAQMIYKVHNISTPKLPLEAYASLDFFKIYLLDIGLLCAMAHLPPKALIEGDTLFQEFRGALVENYVVQELTRNEQPLYYWTSEGKAEIDFILQRENHIFPIEVKSGNSKRKQSLRVYQDKYQPKLALRFSPMNLRKDGKILNCPLYLIHRLGDLLENKLQ